MVKNCDRGLENAALGLRPRAVFPSRQITYISYFFYKMYRELRALVPMT